MQAYRTRARVKQGQIVVLLPEAFSEAEIEVIVLPAESNPIVKSEQSSPPGRKKMSKYRGVLKSGLSRQQLDAQLQKLREEWERPI
jgi:hypothetical protein